MRCTSDRSCAGLAWSHHGLDMPWVLLSSRECAPGLVRVVVAECLPQMCPGFDSQHHTQESKQASKHEGASISLTSSNQPRSFLTGGGLPAVRPDVSNHQCFPCWI